MKIYNVVSALIMTSNDDVLLIKQLKPDRPDTKFFDCIEDDFVWVFPGGKMEEGETREEALAREVQEETGLIVQQPFEYISRCQYTNPSENWRCDIHLYVVRHWTGEIDVQDPCNRVVSAQFYPKLEAITQIDTIPWLCMREPLGEYLKGDHQTKDWYYQFSSDSTISRVDEQIYDRLIQTMSEAA